MRERGRTAGEGGRIESGAGGPGLSVTGLSATGLSVTGLAGGGLAAPGLGAAAAAGAGGPGQIDVVRMAAWLIIAGIIIGLLYYGQDILIPLAIAFLVSFALSPMVRWLVRRRVPQVAAVIAVMATVLTLLLGLGTLMVSQIAVLSGELPAYQSTIRSKITALDREMESPGVFDGMRQTMATVQEQVEAAFRDPKADTAEAVPVAVVSDGASQVDTALAWLAPVLTPLATLGIVLVFVFLVLLDRGDLRDRLIRLLGGNLHRSTDALEEAGKRISKYLLMQLLVNISYGIPMAVGLWFIGVPGWILWGTLSALMRFVPYVGPILAAVFPVALSFAVDPGWSMVLWAIALIVTLELVSNNVVEPLLYGSSTGLSALSLIASATFWTALWGPVGLILSTPLTVCLLVIGRNLPQLAFFDTLLGSTPALDLPTRIYQRLIADDPEEAYEIASEAIGRDGLLTFYDETGIEVLRRASEDYHLNARAEHRLRVANGMDQLLDDLREDHPPLPAVGAAVPRVACIGGKWQVDAISCEMLAHALGAAGVPAVQRATGVVTARYVDRLELEGIETVVLAYFSQDHEIAVRGFARRMRRRWPQVRLMLALWDRQEEGADAERAAALGVDRVVISIEEAVQRLVLEHAPEQAAQADAAGADPQEDARLAAVAQLGRVEAPMREALDELAARAADAFDVSFAVLTLCDAQGEHVIGQSMDLAGRALPFAQGPEAILLPRGEDLFAALRTADGPVEVTDIARDARLSGNPTLERWGVRSWVGVPVKAGTGETLGGFYLFDREPRDLEDSELDLFATMATDAAELLTAEDLPEPEPLRRTDPSTAVLGQPIPE